MKLYHATYASNIPSILSVGLVPNKKHNWTDFCLDNQVFMAFNPEVAENFLITSETYEDETREEEEVAIFEINADALDLEKFRYDWNMRCSDSNEIISVAYEGSIPASALHLLSEDDRKMMPLNGFEDLRRGIDETASRIYWILADVFDEQVQV